MAFEDEILAADAPYDDEGKDILRAVEELQKDQALAREIGEHGQYLAAEILHPDNIKR